MLIALQKMSKSKFAEKPQIIILKNLICMAFGEITIHLNLCSGSIE